MTAAIAIAGPRDTHEHYPHPPLPGTLRAIGAAAYKAAAGVCSQPNLVVTTNPVGVFKIEVEVRYDNPVFGFRIARKARAAARRLRQLVADAATAATANLGLPGVRIVVIVTPQRGGAA